MIVAVPDIPVPVTTPVPKPTLAVPDALLVQLPGVVASLNVVVRPEHTVRVPVIAAGNGLTVTIAVIIQVVGNV